MAETFTMYFAWTKSPPQVHDALAERSLRSPVAILVSFPFVKQFRKTDALNRLNTRSTMLDSGAFTVWNSGGVVDINELVAEGSRGWSECVMLDDILDYRISMQNAEKMRRLGSTAFPVFHIGEPWHVLMWYAERFEKVGLSCRFGESEPIALRWLDQCFSRIWPKKAHSFGWVSENALMQVPFHSADASSWYLAPMKYGRVSVGSNTRIKTVAKFSEVNIRDDIDRHLELEERVRVKWRKQLEKL